MNESPIIEKIRKLLALAGSSNPHEAAAALRKARELQEAYRISDADLTDSTYAVHVLQGDTLDFNVSTLGIILMDYFHVVLLHWERRGGRTRIMLFGTETDVAIGAYVFHYLDRQLDRDWRTYRRSMRKNLKRATVINRREKFSTGWINAVKENLGVPSTHENEAGIMILPDAALHGAAQKAFGWNDNRDKKVYRMGDSGLAGSEMGSRVRVRSAIADDSQVGPRLLGGGA